MVKKLGIALLALIMVACSQGLNFPTPNTTMYGQTNQDIPYQVMQWSQTNVWKVITEFGRGSGFWINDNHFVTNCHVVNGRDTVIIENYTETLFLYAGVSNCDENADLALLTIHNTEGFKPLQTYILPDRLAQGKAIYGVGYPLGLRLTIVEGHAQLWYSQGPGQGITAPTIFGDSGGPALYIENGIVYVAGIRSRVFIVPVMFIRVPVPHLALMYTGEQLIEYLDGIEIDDGEETSGSETEVPPR